MGDDYASAAPTNAFIKRNSSSITHSHSQSSTTHFSKFLTMIICLGCDLALNSILDYDLFNDQYRGASVSAQQANSHSASSNNTTVAQLLIGLAGLQIVIQIAIFLILFLSMADTFLFRVSVGCCYRFQLYRVTYIFKPSDNFFSYL
jgi:hypothetical protein